MTPYPPLLSILFLFISLPVPSIGRLINSSPFASISPELQERKELEALEKFARSLHDGIVALDHLEEDQPVMRRQKGPASQVAKHETTRELASE